LFCYGKGIRSANMRGLLVSIIRQSETGAHPSVLYNAANAPYQRLRRQCVALNKYCYLAQGLKILVSTLLRFSGNNQQDATL